MCVSCLLVQLYSMEGDSQNPWAKGSQVWGRGVGVLIKRLCFHTRFASNTLIAVCSKILRSNFCNDQAGCNPNRVLASFVFAFALQMSTSWYRFCTRHFSWLFCALGLCRFWNFASPNWASYIFLDPYSWISEKSCQIISVKCPQTNCDLIDHSKWESL